ncbi:Uncharacterized protein Fot_14893 [Forsythia ovata]|uniref:Uncharacterized protein n=1 Tax=Forsythia ovata TaxID=205694 RepID=A0ABD1WB81_9LAMI
MELRPLIELGWKHCSIPFVKGKVPKAKSPYLCQMLLDQAGCKSNDVHEWQGPEGESQQANPQDRPPQYFSENLPHTRIEPSLPEDFSPRHFKPYQLAYAPGGSIARFLDDIIDGLENKKFLKKLFPDM